MSRQTTIAKIRKALNPSEWEAVQTTAESLPDEYFETVSPDQSIRHLKAILQLTPTSPVEMVWDAQKTAITVCTSDRTGLFSILAGVLAATGFNVLAGSAFTSTDGTAIDTFQGQTPTGVSPDQWLADVGDKLRSVLQGTNQQPPTDDAVRSSVIELVASSKALRDSTAPATLLPISLDFENNGATRIDVRSQDTPFFLYSLGTALSLQGFLIDRVEIRTTGQEIFDSFWVRRGASGNIGQPATDQDLDRLRVAVLVTKQFSQMLPQAADPKAALERFEQLVQDVTSAPNADRLLYLLARPERQEELARLLGASDFLWEDFIRLQYENLLPLLEVDDEHMLLSTPSDKLAGKLESLLNEAATFQERSEILNRFKDYESYLIDADHILRRNTDFFFLSHRLTRLADLICDTAFQVSWSHLTERYGTPRTAGNVVAPYALFGLGKLGGSALGFASDIELMCIYSDHGETDAGISNREFFERLVKTATGMIRAPREGIFRVDLRLRPFGNDGPLAVHLESFISYFGPGGPAHSVERLALIRLRHIAGDSDLGARVVAIRDQLVYEGNAIRVAEIRDFRFRQIQEKASGPVVNAKFSPGAMVDLEYNVQLLQVQYGRANQELRNPGIHATLRGLSQAGEIDSAEAESMVRAYRFFRTLINGLRMLRGNARDLVLPRYDTLEFVHLARRMGYHDDASLSAADRLRLDFETETAKVRSFVERHLGEDALPEQMTGSPADLVLSDTVSEGRAATALRDAGFRDPDRGVVNLRRLARRGKDPELFARLVVLAWEYLRAGTDPDMALNNWERFTERLENYDDMYRTLLAQPKRMEILFQIFAGSQFLADSLVQRPDFADWITDPQVTDLPKTQATMRGELSAALANCEDRTAGLNQLRRFRRREILRIGTRDICMARPFTEIVSEVSSLARTCIDGAYEVVRRDEMVRRDELARNELERDTRERYEPERDGQIKDHAKHVETEEHASGNLAILAFGKLGGRELNYSSDIDLLAVYEPDANVPDQEQRCGRLFRGVVRALTDFTEEGRAYRVDLRLRPYGDAGRLAYARPNAVSYYAEKAELWELQTLLKLAPVAGDMALGRRFVEAVRPFIAKRTQSAGHDRIVDTVRGLRHRAVQQYESDQRDVKNGEGGIRDIEFAVQTLQLLHLSVYPELFTGNTLLALSKLEETGLLDPSTVARMREDYVFLRRVEHFLQVYQDRQLHSVPEEPEAQAKLARLVFGSAAEAHQLNTVLTETVTRVRSVFDQIVR